MNLNQLKYFQLLAQYEHYGRAAQELHITQPSLSKAMQALEKELGVSLFEKSGRGIKLTVSGQHFLEYVNRSFRELECGFQRMRSETPNSGGFIRLGMISPIENDLIPTWIRGFLDHTGKQVFFSCKSDVSRVLTRELKDGIHDLIFCTELKNEPTIEFIPIWEQPLVVIVPKSHRLASMSSIHISELNSENIVAHTRDSAMWDISSRMYLDANIKVTITGEAEEDRTVLAMVRAGLGCAITADHSGIHAPDVSVIPLCGIDYHRFVCVGYRKDSPLSPAAEEFLNFILA